MSVTPEHDPTMEEILLSVRRMIIVDDEIPPAIEIPISKISPNVVVPEPTREREASSRATPTTIENLFEQTLREAFEPALASYLSVDALSSLRDLNPIVQEWLNAHFEAILTGVVRGEVEKIVRAQKSQPRALI